MLHTSLILAVAHPYLLEATGNPSSGAQPSLTQNKRIYNICQLQFASKFFKSNQESKPIFSHLEEQRVQSCREICYSHEYTNPAVNSLFKPLWRTTEQIDRSKIGNEMLRSHLLFKEYVNSLDMGQNFGRLLEETAQYPGGCFPGIRSWVKSLILVHRGWQHYPHGHSLRVGRGIQPPTVMSAFMVFLRLKHSSLFRRYF